METDIERLLRMLAEGVEKASPASLIGETALKIEGFQQELDACAERSASHQSELCDVSERIEQGVTLDASEMESLLARQHVLQKLQSLNTEAREVAQRRCAEGKRRLLALREEYRLLLTQQQNLESHMRYVTASQYAEQLGQIRSRMTELVGNDIPPFAEYVAPPIYECTWV
jgi:DNA repair exonuclease SbcCD ATPase subunit